MKKLLIKEIKKFGLGADVVSKGELMLALKAGVNPSKIVFSGVGKTYEEIAELAVYLWYKSPPHRFILLSEAFNPINNFVGVSIILCPNGPFYGAANVIGF